MDTNQNDTGLAALEQAVAGELHDIMVDFDDALARAFAKVERARPDGVDCNIKKDGKDRRYVTLASVDQACREALTSEEFSFPQLATTEKMEGGGLWLTVTTQLRRKGVKIEATFGLPVLGQMIAARDGGGFREPTAQSVGSALTYGRRYALSALMGVCPDDDDDGHSASYQNNVAKADPLWDAYVVQRDLVAKAKKMTAEQAHTFIRESVGIAYSGEPSDGHVRAMTAEARKILAAASAPKSKGKSKKAPEVEALNDARASADIAMKAYRDECEAQGVDALPWLEVAKKALGKPWSVDKGAHGAEDYYALAEAFKAETARVRGTK